MALIQEEVVAPMVAEAARSLARAIGDSDVFTRFEAAQERFTKDTELQQQLRDHEARQQHVRSAELWDGADSKRTQMEQQWQTLLQNPVLQTYLTSEEELRNLLRDAAARISKEVGIDYSAACKPAGGCC